MTERNSSGDKPKAPKDTRNLRRIQVGGSSQSSDIQARRRYRVKIEGEWYEGQFSRQWFGWQFDGYRNGIQLNLIDEVFEIVQAPQPRFAINVRVANYLGLDIRALVREIHQDDVAELKPLDVDVHRHRRECKGYRVCLRASCPASP